jgi:hypothetical protein
MRMGKPVFKKHVGTSTLADILLQTIKQKIYKVIRHIIHSEWGGCPRRKLQRGTALGSKGQHRSQVLEVNYSVNLVNHIHRSVSREEGTSCVQLPEQASCTPKKFPRCSDHMSTFVGILNIFMTGCIEVSNKSAVRSICLYLEVKTLYNAPEKKAHQVPKYPLYNHIAVQ